MSRTMTQSTSSLKFDPLNILKKSAQSWFVVALFGQLIFVVYILAFYWLNTMQGDFEALNKELPNGVVEGDLIGNISLITHVLIAAIITFCGPLQLIPKVREVAPRFHHWNGRVYLLTAFFMSVSGLYIVWTRGTVGDWVQRYAISLNAILIMLFAIFALKNAIARNIAVHRRWALRLFMVVSGVWFFRVGLMFWLIVNQGPVGIDLETFTGPFMYFIAFANYLLPLAFLELYFRAQASSNNIFRLSVSGLILLAALMTLGGIGAATMGMWFPKI